MIIKAPWQTAAGRQAAGIKTHYLKSGHTLDEWQHVSQNPALFNRAWRKMLGIEQGDMPPPMPFRVLPA